MAGRHDEQLHTQSAPYSVDYSYLVDATAISRTHERHLHQSRHLHPLLEHGYAHDGLPHRAHLRNGSFSIEVGEGELTSRTLAETNSSGGVLGSGLSSGDLGGRKV